MALTEKQNKLQTIITEDIRSVQSRRFEIHTRVERLKRMWKGERTKKMYRGRANVSLNFPYWYSESMVPRYMASVFGGREIMDVLPLPSGTFNGAFANKAIMNYQLIFEMDGFQNILSFCEAVSRSLMATMKVKWNPRQQHPDIHLIPPGDFLWDPRSGPLWKRARWKVHFIRKDRQELEAGARELGYFPEQVAEITQAERNLSRTVTETGDHVGKARAFYEGVEWWGSIPVDWGVDVLGKEAMRAVPRNARQIPVIALVVADKLLRVVASPYKNEPPFLHMWDVHDPFELSGYSENEFIESINNMSSDLMNQRLDNVSMAINRLWTVLKGSGVKREQLLSVPWGLVEVMSHDDIKEREVMNVTQDAYRELGILGELMKSSTGLLDQQRGLDQPSVDSATGMQLLMAKSDLRPDLKVKWFQYVVIAGLGELMLKQNGSFLTLPKAGFIIGEHDPQKAIQRWSPDTIQGGYKVMPAGFSITGAKDIRIGQLTNLLNTLRGLEGQGPNVMVPVIEEILNLADVKKANEAIDEWKQGRQRMAEQQNVANRASLLSTMRQGLLPGPRGLPGSPNVPGQLPAGVGAVPPGEGQPGA